MKAYTIYLNNERGWTDYAIDPFGYEYENIIDEEELAEATINQLPTTKQIENIIYALNVGETYQLKIGNMEFKVVCEEINSEEVMQKEFSEW